MFVSGASFPSKVMTGAGLVAKVLLAGDYKADEEERNGYRARKSNRRQSSNSCKNSSCSSVVDVEKELEAIKKGR